MHACMQPGLTGPGTNGFVLYKGGRTWSKGAETWSKGSSLLMKQCARSPSSILTAGATANTTKGNSRAYRVSVRVGFAFTQEQYTWRGAAQIEPLSLPQHIEFATYRCHCSCSGPRYRPSLHREREREMPPRDASHR